MIGGGTAAPAGGTQIMDGGRATRGAAPAGARADASAVTIGRTVYVVGGYDGVRAESQVVSTTDGRSYRPVAALRVPVRYPAIAMLGSQIYVFGGLGANGHPSNVVQLIDPANRTARVVGRLPRPLDGASAGVLDGTVYLAGGRTAAGPTRAIYAFQPGKVAFLRAGSLRVPTANAGAAVSDGRLWIVGGESSSGQPASDVQMVVPNPGFGKAGDRGAGSPFAGGQLLIADRGSDRLLLLNDRDQVVWRYPSPGRAAPRGGFYFPDDAFFIRHGSAIISNQEDNDTIVEIAYPSGRITFHYGHPRTPGFAPGYLNTPDDAYLLGNGDMTVADPGNCRVLVIDPRTKRVLHQIGTPGRCVHDPPPALGSPNGDTPLANGDLLVSEINGSWIDELTPAGRRVWAAPPRDRLPLRPSTARTRPLPRRRLRASGWNHRVERQGRIVYRYQPAGGLGELDHPVARRAAPLRRVHGQRRLQRPDGRDRPGDPRDRLAIRRGRTSRHNAGAAQHPGRLRPSRPRRKDTNPSDDRITHPTLTGGVTMTPSCECW